MSIVRVQVSIPQEQAGVGADAYVNTWHFRNIGTSTEAQSAVDAIGWLRTFYQAIDAQWPTALVGTPAVVKAYDLSDEEPRAPIVEDTIALTTTGTEGLAPELSVCLSYRALYRSGVPKARCRGRVFLPPMTISAMDFGRPGSTEIGQISTAAAALLTSSQASTDTVWQVHSSFIGETVDQNVIGGWVDNEWDVQRRRSLEVTSRNEFGAGH